LYMKMFVYIYIHIYIYKYIYICTCTHIYTYREDILAESWAIELGESLPLEKIDVDEVATTLLNTLSTQVNIDICTHLFIYLYSYPQFKIKNTAHYS
jgi:hypothetical protein